MEKVVWTDPAVDDLREIHRYIAHDSVQQANRFIDRLIEAAENSALFPESGRAIAKWHGQTIRQTVYSGYRILYCWVPGACQIIGVMHGQRDLDPWLSDRTKD